MAINERLPLLNFAMAFIIILSILYSFNGVSNAEKCINLNTADKEELMEIHQIDDVRSDKILKMREEGFIFKNVDDMIHIKGIGENYLDEIKNDKDVCVVGSDDVTDQSSDINNQNNEEKEELFVPETATNNYIYILAGSTIILLGSIGLYSYNRKSV